MGGDKVKDVTSRMVVPARGDYAEAAKQVIMAMRADIQQLKLFSSDDIILDDITHLYVHIGRPKQP